MLRVQTKLWCTVYTRYHSRFFVQVEHETSYAAKRNHHYLVIYMFCKGWECEIVFVLICWIISGSQLVTKYNFSLKHVIIRPTKIVKDLCKASLALRRSLIIIMMIPYSSHLSTAVARREKKSKQFVFNKYFSLVLGVLKSKI